MMKQFRFFILKFKNFSLLNFDYLLRLFFILDY
jgi:hypothetical protein